MVSPRAVVRARSRRPARSIPLRGSRRSPLKIVTRSACTIVARERALFFFSSPRRERLATLPCEFPLLPTLRARFASIIPGRSYQEFGRRARYARPRAFVSEPLLSRVFLFSCTVPRSFRDKITRQFSSNAVSFLTRRLVYALLKRDPH